MYHCGCCCGWSCDNKLYHKKIVNSKVLFRRPNANCKHNPLALGNILEVAKQPNSNLKEYTIGYLASNSLDKIDEIPKMEK